MDEAQEEESKYKVEHWKQETVTTTHPEHSFHVVCLKTSKKLESISVFQGVKEVLCVTNAFSVCSIIKTNPHIPL